MLEKYISQLGCDDEGMPLVQYAENVDVLVKRASQFGYTYSQTFLDAIERLKETKSDDEIICSVIALGAGEFFSSNVNGDFFYEKTLKKILKTWESSVLFEHHRNTDVEEKLGDIRYAEYNDKMHRVELLIAPSRTLAPTWVASIEAGNPVDVSFGYKTPWDECSICGNRAKSRAQYCIHLKTQMNQTLDDGRKVYAINPDIGRFFELSFVSKGAVPIAKIMQKVASGGAMFIGHSAIDDSEDDIGVYAGEVEKTSASKYAEIIKEIESNLTRSGADAVDLKDSVPYIYPYVNDMEKPLNPRLFAGREIDDVFGTLGVMGIVPTLREFMEIVRELRMSVDDLKRAIQRVNDKSYEYGVSSPLMEILNSDGNDYSFSRSWHLPRVLHRQVIIRSGNIPFEMEKFSSEDEARNRRIIGGGIAGALAAALYSANLRSDNQAKILGAVDKFIKQHPIAAMSLMFGAGALPGFLVKTKAPAVTVSKDGLKVNPQFDYGYSIGTESMDKVSGVGDYLNRLRKSFVAGKKGFSKIYNKGVKKVKTKSKNFPAAYNNPQAQQATPTAGATQSQGAAQGNERKGMGFLKGIALPFLGGQLLSAHMYNKKENGEDVGRLGEIVADNPLATSLTGVVGLQAGRHAVGKFLKKTSSSISEEDGIAVFTIGDSMRYIRQNLANEGFWNKEASYPENAITDIIISI